MIKGELIYKSFVKAIFNNIENE